MNVIRRRAFLTGLSALPLTSCNRQPPGGDSTSPSLLERKPNPPSSPERFVPSRPPRPSARDGAISDVGATKVEVLTFPARPGLPSCTAAVVVPEPAGAEAFPLLIALHGRGEALKGPALAVQGWPRDYALQNAMKRMASPPLTSSDLEEIVDPARLAVLNEELSRKPYRGLVVACPFVPDHDLRSEGIARAMAKFIVEDLIVEIRRRFPVLAGPEHTGIDGVSLGGITALRIGFFAPRAFGAIGSLQAALSGDDIGRMTVLAQAARRENPSAKLRLVTSSEDYFRSAIRRTSEAWRASHVDHEFLEIPGPHDYAFNRGPGVYEMLSWHHRWLSRCA